MKYETIFDVFIDGESIEPVGKILQEINASMRDFGFGARDLTLNVSLPVTSIVAMSDRELTHDEKMKMAGVLEVEYTRLAKGKLADMRFEVKPREGCISK